MDHLYSLDDSYHVARMTITRPIMLESTDSD